MRDRHYALKMIFCFKKSEYLKRLISKIDLVRPADFSVLKWI